MPPTQPNTSLCIFTKDDLQYAKDNKLFSNVCSKDSISRFVYFVNKFREYYPQSLGEYLYNLQNTNDSNFFIPRRLESLCFGAYNCVELLINASKSHYVQSLHVNESYRDNNRDALPSQSPSHSSYENRSLMRRDFSKVNLKFNNGVYIAHIGSSNKRCIEACDILTDINSDFINKLSYVNSCRNIMVHESVVSSDDSYFGECVLDFLSSFYGLVICHGDDVVNFVCNAFVFEENLP